MISMWDVLSSESFNNLIDTLIMNNTVRRNFLAVAEKDLYRRLVLVNRDDRPQKVQEDKFYTLRNMLYSLDKALGGGLICRQARRKVFEILVGKIFREDVEKRDAHRARYGHCPPCFITISPGKACNLRCVGCYASSSAASSQSLDYEIVSRILREKTQLWGSHFTVISGGEPLIWKSRGKGILDIAEEHNDNYFLMYTNGTLIDKDVAAKMAQLGNITPAISVEGFEEQTDARRGKGVHKKILAAFDNLRQVGVPFGISITATGHNAEIVVSDEFIDYYFGQQGAIYGWIFQYMPIGHKYTMDLMVTPQQRLMLYRREQELLKEKRIFFADFWNSGPVSNGCISAGRPGGYFYIDWNGNVMPCVFFPYTVDNIMEVYQKGGDLNTVLNSAFFKAIREWQSDYSYLKPRDQVGNQIVPCIIRDHHRIARQIVERFGARPADKAAEEALRDREYYQGLTAYGEEVARLCDPIWEKQYLRANHYN
ncbi:MAG: hypothetical protein B1H40_02615 [Candidatus Latescibacteria bacterium 4484_181]|nr:MAG: hypothetical protein B1H40_02615 [Candidatus Latescibacteria bacterium 4484_181]RKY69678.1 MAG: radical SAM protein [Candidatus Latescibacterota bacterium]RKY73561.1 MAG: radical SAM protein [Candidatus Latescibacterota bacterium]